MNTLLTGFIFVWGGLVLALNLLGITGMFLAADSIWATIGQGARHLLAVQSLDLRDERGPDIACDWRGHVARAAAGSRLTGRGATTRAGVRLAPFRVFAGLRARKVVS
jgi:hypothetical protein